MNLLVLKNQEFQMKKQNLVPMIHEVISSMQYRLQEQKILVNLNLKPTICEVEADLLKSLILNLVDNSLKSMNVGGILTIECCPAQEGAKIYVSDKGDMEFISQEEKGTTAIITIGGGHYEKTD